MNFQPTLKNNLVEVRPLRQEDYESLFKAASDPEIWAGMPAKNRHQREPFTKFFNYLLGTGKSFCIVDAKINKPIGTTRYYLTEDRLCMGSTFLEREYWGGEYNNSFRNLLIEHAFQYYDAIYIHITKDNTRNQRATEKLGFHYAFDETLTLGAGKERTFMTYRMYKTIK